MRWSVGNLLALAAALAAAARAAKGCSTVPTQGGTAVPTECVFPFRFNGKEHGRCTGDTDEEGKLWCSVGVDKDGNHIKGKRLWGHCDPKTCLQAETTTTSTSTTTEDPKICKTVSTCLPDTEFNHSEQQYFFLL